MNNRKIFAYAVGTFWAITIVFRLFFRAILYGVLSFMPKPIAAPDVISDSKYGQHEFITIKSTAGEDNHEINLKIHCVISGPANKPIMLMVHGFPEFWYSYRFQILEFQKTHRVIAIDMRGYGDSDKPANRVDYRMSHLVNDLHKIIEHFSSEPITLLSHDWGGAIAWQFLLMHPQQVKNFVSMNGPFGRATMKVMSSKPAQFLKSWYIFMFQLPWFPEFTVRSQNYAMIDKMLGEDPIGVKNKQNMTQEDLQCFKYSMDKKGCLTSAINYYRNVFDVDPARNTQAIPEEIHSRVNLLMVWGEADLALDTAIPRKMLEYFPKMKGKFLPGISHWVQQDAPEEVNRAIHELLDSVE